MVQIQLSSLFLFGLFPTQNGTICAATPEAFPQPFRTLLLNHASENEIHSLDRARSQLSICLNRLDSQLARPLVQGSTEGANKAPLLNPWISPMSIVPPVKVQSFRYWNDNPVKMQQPSRLEESIPAPYHLAEHLGIGTNSVQLEIRFVDGQLFTSTGYGFHIAQRLRYDLVGFFHISQTGEGVRTFRQTIESRLRVKTREINIGPDVKPHKVGFREWHPEDETVRPLNDTPWYQERLDLRFPDHFQSVKASPLELVAEQPIRRQILKHIENQLNQRRLAVIEQQSAAFLTSDLPSSLAQARQVLINWESECKRIDKCDVSIESNKLPSSESILGAIRAQESTRHPLRIDQAYRLRMQQTTLRAIIHGLLHRLPEKEQGRFMPLFRALDESTTVTR